MKESKKMCQNPLWESLREWNNIQIKEGVDENMEVVTGPYRAISRTLKNGDKIEVVKELKKEEE